MSRDQHVPYVQHTVLLGLQPRSDALPPVSPEGQEMKPSDFILKWWDRRKFHKGDGTGWGNDSTWSTDKICRHSKASHSTKPQPLLGSSSPSQISKEFLILEHSVIPQSIHTTPIPHPICRQELQLSLPFPIFPHPPPQVQERGAGLIRGPPAVKWY